MKEMSPYRLSDGEYSRILEFKRDLHMHPELSGEELETTKKIKAFLQTLPDFRILPLETETRTGVVAQIRGRWELDSQREPEDQRMPDGQREPEDLRMPDGQRDACAEIMLRADIDALPQTETCESPWKSRNPGVMHACGHDFHTASLLGAALLLQRAKADGRLHRTVDLVFQPAEEGARGARMMIEAGLFDLIHPEFCFGMHNWPSVPSGRIVCHEGALMSGKRNFDITIHGVGGHGSMPHLCTDAIVCASAVVQSLQTIVSRNTDPLDSVLLTINLIEGGSPINLIVEKIRLCGTVRSLSDEALDRAISRVETIVSRTAEAYECTAEIEWTYRIPTVWNTPEMTARARRCAEATGYTVTDAVPSLASEDFACYREYVSSFFYWVGSMQEGETPQDLHKPGFHTDDSMLRCAAELYMASAIIS